MIWFLRRARPDTVFQRPIGIANMFGEQWKARRSPESVASETPSIYAPAKKTGGGIPPTPKVTGSSMFEASGHEQPLVPPQVRHFRQVPLRTRVKFPHSLQASPS